MHNYCGIQENHSASLQFNYEINNNEITITKYLDSSKEVDIPESIEGYLVTIIGDKAFSEQQLTKVKLPKSLKRIGEFAFYGNSIPILNIPEKVTEIEKGAFDWSKITEFSIQNNHFIFENGLLLTTDRKTIIAGIGILSEIVVPETVYYIGDLAFKDNILRNIKLSKKLEDIGFFAFSNSQLTSISIPKNVKNIGMGAFSHNQIKRITIPKSVINISQLAFVNNALKQIMILGEETRFNDRWEEIGFPTQLKPKK